MLVFIFIMKKRIVSNEDLSMKRLKEIIFLNMLIASMFALSSCGGDGIGGTGYPLEDINSTPQGNLYRSSEESLSVYFQQSVKLQNNNKDLDTTISVADGAEGDAFSGDGGGDSIVSSTNIQEFGVEEADLVKTNGKTIYSVTSSSARTGKGEGSPEIKSEDPDGVSGVIRILEPEGKSLKEVKRFTRENSHFSGLYLHHESNHLIALSSENQNYYANWFNGSYFANQSTEVLIIDVEDSAKASIQTTLSFEGTLINSRRNKDTLYMVLRHYPNYLYVDDERLLDTTTKDFLPTYKFGKGDSQLISKAEDCFLEKGRIDKSDIITIISLDLKSDIPQIKSQCFVGSVEAMYASTKSLYLATTRWDYQNNNGISVYQTANITTDIHKFAYDALDFEYRGSGEVSGHLGHNQDGKSFRFSESEDGLLRVVTFDEEQWGVIFPVDDGVIEGVEQGADKAVARIEVKEKSPVSLSILKENSSKKVLEVVSKLPNESRPEPIGLPGERLYATRYIGDHAYVVTFRVTDPLYVIDLSNPEDPFIAGELKVDGYSDYLHPVSENLILGIGKDAVSSGSSLDGRGAWYQGVKLSLIDVSSPSNPREVDKVILGKRGTEAGVLFDHHAFTSVMVDNKYRVAIPVRLHEEENPVFNGGELASTYHKFKNLGLYRFEVDVDTQKIIVKSPMIIQDAASSDAYVDVINDRSIFLNDNIHYMHNGDFWSQDWKGLGALLGPK